MYRIERLTTDQATQDLLVEIRRLCETAFEGDFSAEDWQHALGGLHVVAIDEGSVIAHAAVISRRIEVAARPFRTGYVEAVATAPNRQREGLGSSVMTEIGAAITAHFEMGALSTDTHEFYHRLGWERWLGPTRVRPGSEHIRSETDDGVMVLRLGPSTDIDLSAEISCEARSGDDW